MSVVLVHMPFAVVTHPSIALSLLKAGLARVNIPCRVHYANLEFVEQAGHGLAMQVSYSTGAHELFGEWIFSEAAFREDAPTGYIEALGQARPKYCLDEAILRRCRQAAKDYVEDLAQRLVAENPRILGCSSMFQQHCASLALLRRVKELAPGIVTVLGGANCEGPMGLAVARNFPWVDFAVSGEADEIFPEFCRLILAGQQPDRLYGVIARGRAYPQVPRATVARLDTLAVPDYDDYFATLDRSSLVKNIEPGLLLETSRGCWWGQKHHCTFCGLNGGGMGYRSKSAERVLAETDTLAERYGVKGFEVVDNILDMAHFKSLLPVWAERGAPYRFFYETKSNLKRSQVELLARSGVRWIQPGIESLHDRVLELMDKGSNALMNVQLLRHAREFGVRVIWNFLHGFPGERSEWSGEMAAWLPLIHHLHSPSGASFVRYDRFSPYHERPENYGIQIRPNDFYAKIYPLPDQELADLAYFFDDEQPSPRVAIDEHRRALILAVHEWRDLWNNRVLYPLLSIREREGRLQILDTRPCAPERRVVLDGQAREVLLALDQPVPLAQLTAEQQRVALELVERKLVLHLNGKLLSLAVAGEIPTLPDPTEFPGGNPNVEQPVYQPRSLAGR